MESSPSLTEQLQRFSAGDRSIAEAVLPEVLPRLRQIAVGHLQRERHVAPLCPTELIHEVWLRNLHQGGWQVRDRDHFYSIAAYAMRQVLVDFARQRLAAIRGGGVAPLSIDQAGNGLEAAVTSQEQIVEIGIAMDRLEKRDRLAARIVDLHYFAGFTLEETAGITGLTLRQLRHRWEKTRKWLQTRLSP